MSYEKSTVSSWVYGVVCEKYIEYTQMKTHAVDYGRFSKSYVTGWKINHLKDSLSQWTLK